MTGEIVKSPNRIGARNPANYAGALVNEPPLSVGVRNPFVYAEHKSGKKIDWDQMSPGKKRKKLEDAFDGKPYNQLFDSRNDSPLFVQTGDVRPCTTVSNPTWEALPNSTYTDTVNKTRAYNDPVQGALPDCYFIAALSSIAFADFTTNYVYKLIQDKTGTDYTYYFWNPPSNAPIKDPQPITISNKLPLDSTKTYRYSKSFTAGEIWVAMYEKAFAAWKKRSLVETPDYSLICTGDPVLALLNITGWKYDQNTTFLTKNLTESLIYSKILSVCKNSPVPLPLYSVTQKPMVAYTYDPRIEIPPSGITYEDATIVANHSYSVLGVLTQGGSNYIVMRNPWGQKGAGPGFGDPDPTKLLAGAMASGPWYKVPELSDPNDAVFALRVDIFKKYFKGFGWVIP
jgi:hypothetical protein